MKLILVFLALVGGSFAYPGKSEVLADDLTVPVGRLLANVDLVEFDRVIREIFQTDQGMLLLLFLRGATFGRILDAVEAEVEINNIFDYIELNGYPDIRQSIEDLWAELGIPRPTSSPRDMYLAPNATFEELLEQLNACVDRSGLLETLLDVINNDLPSIKFFAYVSREPVHEAWVRLQAQEDIAGLIALLESVGLPVGDIIALLEGLLGWDSKH